MMFYFAEGVRINPQEKIQDPARVQNQDLQNTRQTLLPLGEEQKQATLAALPRAFSWIPTGWAL